MHTHTTKRTLLGHIRIELNETYKQKSEITSSYDLSGQLSSVDSDYQILAVCQWELDTPPDVIWVHFSICPQGGAITSLIYTAFLHQLVGLLW